MTAIHASYPNWDCQALLASCNMLHEFSQDAYNMYTPSQYGNAFYPQGYDYGQYPTEQQQQWYQQQDWAYHQQQQQQQQYLGQQQQQQQDNFLPAQVTTPSPVAAATNVHNMAVEGSPSPASSAHTQNPSTPARVVQRPPYEWMKKQDLPTKPANGKTRTRDKYRVVYSDHQRVELEKEYRFSHYITIRRKSEIAAALNLTERQVKIWFQNRRAKERRSEKKNKTAVVSSTVSPGAQPAGPGPESPSCCTPSPELKLQPMASAMTSAAAVSSSTEYEQLALRSLSTMNCTPYIGNPNYTPVSMPTQ